MLQPSRYYLWRTLQDDRSDQVKPGTVLDPLLMIYRVAEAISVGLAFAKALSDDNHGDARVLGFAFKWSKLLNRRLDAWANPMVFMDGSGQSRLDTTTTYVEVPLETPANAIAPFVAQATDELFSLFDGHEVPFNIVEENVLRLVERKMKP